MELTTFTDTHINVEKGGIMFLGYAALKEEATQLAAHIQQVEVTEDNIKESKKLLAAVNNRIKELEARRISVKKELLEPYTHFESQVKEIVNLVTDANTVVRTQVRELEEFERAEKKKRIESIFDKRVSRYNFSHYITFNDFIRNQHLNKTYSMDKVEQEMVNWLEDIADDIFTLNDMFGEEGSGVYFTRGAMNLNLTIGILAPIEDTEEEPECVVTDIPEPIYEYTVHIKTDEEAKTLESILSKNGFNYRVQIKN